MADLAAAAKTILISPLRTSAASQPGLNGKDKHMKRFRVFQFDFDTRVRTLTDEIQEHWEERVKEQHRRNQEQTVQELIQQFGAYAADRKRQNFIDLGTKPFSILAFHNR